MVLLIVLLVVAVLIAAGWLVDRHDRRQGRAVVKDGREVAERIRSARRLRRSARIRLEPGAPRSDQQPRRPVKRGQ